MEYFFDFHHSEGLHDDACHHEVDAALAEPDELRMQPDVLEQVARRDHERHEENHGHFQN